MDSLDYFDTEENSKTWLFLAKFRRCKESSSMISEDVF